MTEAAQPPHLPASCPERALVPGLHSNAPGLWNQSVMRHFRISAREATALLVACLLKKARRQCIKTSTSLQKAARPAPLGLIPADATPCRFGRFVRIWMRCPFRNTILTALGPPTRDIVFVVSMQKSCRELYSSPLLDPTCQITARITACPKSNESHDAGSQQEVCQQGLYLFMSPAGQTHRPSRGCLLFS
jgi:hypothetical protein